jgi:hypothetical protein
MFSPEEIVYIEKRKLKQLSYSIPEESSLFQTIHGAHTIQRAIELDALQSLHYQRQNEKTSRPKTPRREISWELGMMNERCIDENGFSMFQF